MRIYTGEALIFAAGEGDIKEVKRLLDAGVDINCVGGYPIQNAALYGRLEVFKFLLERGADPDLDSNRALRWAAEHRNVSIVKILQKLKPVFIKCAGYKATILDDGVQIGCAMHTFNEWWNFSDAEISRMDGHGSAAERWAKAWPGLFDLIEKHRDWRRP